MRFLKRCFAQLHVWWKRIVLPTPLPSTTTMDKTSLALSLTSQIKWEEEEQITLKEVPLVIPETSSS